MAIQSKAYPIVENAINLFGDWLKHRQEMRELRDMNTGDFARIARDLCMSPAELDAVVRQGPHASDELPRLLKTLGIDAATLSRTQPVDAGTLAQRYEEYCPNAEAINELEQRP
jgi:uncharacterized protein YjiS (DUF1127 family)